MRGERGSSSSKRGRTMRRGNPDRNEGPPPRYRSRPLNFGKRREASTVIVLADSSEWG
jgi:hypothetical protein